MSSTVPPLCLDVALFEYSMCPTKRDTGGKKRGKAASMIGLIDNDAKCSWLRMQNRVMVLDGCGCHCFVVV